jgi:hypothetical protein
VPQVWETEQVSEDNLVRSGSRNTLDKNSLGQVYVLCFCFDLFTDTEYRKGWLSIVLRFLEAIALLLVILLVEDLANNKELLVDLYAQLGG